MKHFSAARLVREAIRGQSGWTEHWRSPDRPGPAYDAVIVGADRVTANGDVCNKIGTYLKALAAHDNGVPFYVALPHTTFDAATASGDLIPIEERSGDEVTWVEGEGGRVRITRSSAANPAFDVTPARLVTGYITERGVLARP